MHLGPTTHAAQQLCTLQTLLYSLNGWGLHVAERAMRRLLTQALAKLP